MLTSVNLEAFMLNYRCVTIIWPLSMDVVVGVHGSIVIVVVCTFIYIYTKISNKPIYMIIHKVHVHSKNIRVTLSHAILEKFLSKKR